MIYNVLKQLDIRTILEAGGNNGDDTKKLIQLFPGAKIYVAECNPRYFKEFLTLPVTFIPMALNDRNGLVDFYLDENPQGEGGASSLFPAKEFFLNDYIKKETKTRVNGITLGSLLELFDIKEIDLFWADLEGAEYSVLSANTELLKRIKYIYAEINHYEFREGMSRCGELEDLLISHGFEIIWKHPDGNPDWQDNYLFKKR